MLNLQQEDTKNILVITSIWLAIIILINPIGNFPLNDDWAYGWSVKTLLETGDFQLSDWTATNLLPQVFWGALFCLPFGFSFTALRFSTLTLGLIGVITTYSLLREANSSPKFSLFGALIVALNPLYFVLSNSFMSDVPSLVFTILSLYFFIRGINQKSSIKINIIIGILISFISILNRQLGIIVLPAFSFVYFIKNGLKVKTSIAALIPTILAVGLYLLYPYWLQTTNLLPVMYSFQSNQLLESSSRNLIDITLTFSKNLLIILVYLGLFLFPLLIINFSVQYKNFSIQQKRFCIFFICFVVTLGSVYFLIKRQRMPLVGNVLNPLSLGLQVLDGYYDCLSLNAIFIINIFWQIMTLLGVFGGALLLQNLLFSAFQILNSKVKLNRKYLLLLIIFSVILYILPIAALKNFWFDRYLILCLPLLLTITSIKITNNNEIKPNSTAISIGLILLFFYGGFSISATHDYLSWNRVRWQALNNLMQESQISPKQINGGFEFNGWYFGNRLEICNPKYQTSSKYSSVNWDDFTCLWGGNNYRYTISFLPKVGYEVEKKYVWKRWLPWRKENMYVLHQNVSI